MREDSHYFFHALIGRSANDALSRIIAWRVQERIGGNALVTIDDYGFLLTLAAFPGIAALEMARSVSSAKARKRICALALRGSELVKWQFRGVAQTGLMVPRNYPGPGARTATNALELGDDFSCARDNMNRIIRCSRKHIARLRISFSMPKSAYAFLDESNRPRLEAARVAGRLAIFVPDLRQQN